MKSRRIMALLLAIAMLISVLPASVAAADPIPGSPEAEMGIKIAGTLCTYDNGTSGVKFEMQVKDGGAGTGDGKEITGTSAITLGLDPSVLEVVKAKNNLGDTLTAGDLGYPNRFIQAGEYLLDPEDPDTSTPFNISQSKLFENENNKYLHIEAALGDVSINADTYTTLATFYTKFVDGASAGSLTKDAVTLLADKDILLSNGISYQFMIGATGSGRCYGSIAKVNDSAEWTPAADKLGPNNLSMSYPRSNETDPAGIDGTGEGVTVDGNTVTIPAPRKGEDYTFALTPTLAAGESASFKLLDGETDCSTVFTSTTNEVTTTFKIDADGRITSSAVSGTFQGTTEEAQGSATMVVTKAADGADPEYTFEVPLKIVIPQVVLPAYALTDAQKTLTLADKKTGAWTNATAVAEALKDTGWELLTQAQADALSSTLAPVAADTELAASETAYEIPVYHAAKDYEFTAGADTVSLTISAIPKQNTVNDIVADGAYTSTKTSIKFTQATNTAWQYGITQTAPAGEATKSVTIDGQAVELVAGTDWTDGTENGVEFTNLKSGSKYYLLARVKDDDTSAVEAASPALTAYDLAVKEAYITKETDKSTLNDAGDKVTATSLSLFDATKNPHTNYTQNITLTNNNGEPVYGLEANVFEVENGAITDTASTEFTAAIVGNPTEVAAGGDFTVTVTPAASLEKGVHSAVLVIKAYGNAEKTDEPVINKEINIELVVYANREANANPQADITVRPAGTSSEAAGSMPVANAAQKIELNATWGEEKASSYKLTGTYDSTAIQLVEEGEGAGKKFYLQFDKDVKTLGSLVTVEATFAKDDTNFLAEEIDTFDVFVKGAPTDAGTGEGGEGALIETAHKVVLPAESDYVIDLTGELAEAGSDESTNVVINMDNGFAADDAKFTLENGVLTIPKGSALQGQGVYVVKTPETDQYVASEITVTVDVFQTPELDALDDIIIEQGENTALTQTLGTVKIDGTAYTGTVTYATEAEGVTINNNEITLDATKAPQTITVTATTAEDATGHWATASVEQKVYVRKATELTGTVKYDLTADSAPVELDITGAEGITYAIHNDTGIIKLTPPAAEGGKTQISIPSPVKYGRTVVTASCAQTNTQTADSIDIEVYVKKASGTEDGEEESNDPTNGTDADILGAKGGEGAELTFNQAFDTWFNASDETAGLEKNKWSTGMEGVLFKNLEAGKRYEIRYMLEGETTWAKTEASHSKPPEAATGCDEDGWWRFEAISGASGVSDAKRFTFVLSSGKLISAQIRLIDEGLEPGMTADPPTEDEDGCSMTVHGLNPALNYQYRVRVSGAFDAADATYEADGWIQLPVSDALRVTDTEDGSKQQITVTRDSAFVGVEIEVVSVPKIEQNTPEAGDYTITGLKPNTAYDIAPGTGFVEDDPDAEPATQKNYITKTSDADGKIVLKAAEITASNLGEPPYLVRESETDTAKPGPETQVNLGVKVEGLVESFAPKKVANLYLFKKEGGKYPSYLVGTDRKQINEDAAAAHTTIGGTEETEESGIRRAQPFIFDAVEPGTYRLLIVKPGNTFYIVNDIEVGSAPIDLKDEAYAADVRKMTLIAGDLNGNGMIDSVDVNYVYTQYWGDTTRADADLNNNGMVDSVDANIIYAENWNKTDYTASGVVSAS